MNSRGLVVYDFQCPCGVEERVVYREKADSQTCKHNHPMTRLFPSPKQWGTGYPKEIVSLPGDPVATSPLHYERLLKANGSMNAHKQNGWI